MQQTLLDRPDAAQSTTALGVPLAATKWSRRSVLGTLSALAVGTVSGCTVPDAGPDGASDIGDLGAGGPGGLSRRRRGGLLGDSYTPQRPYALQAASELTEDFFSVANQPIDPTKDTVVAYSRSDGDVEALVLHDGVISQYYRDPAQPGGWGSQEVTPDRDVERMVAGMSSVDGGGTRGEGRTLKVYYTRGGPTAQQRSPYLYLAVEQTPPKPGSAPAFTRSQIEWNVNCIDLQLNVNADGSHLVAGMQTSGASNGKLNFDARLYFTTDGKATGQQSGATVQQMTGYITGFQYRLQPVRFGPGSGPDWSAVVSTPYQGIAGQFGLGKPTVMLYLPLGSYDPDPKYNPTVAIWACPLAFNKGNVINKIYPWNENIDPPPPLPAQDGEGVAGAVSVEHVTTLGGNNTPVMLVQSLTKSLDSSKAFRRLWLGSHDVNSPVTTGNYTAWTWTQIGQPLIPDGVEAPPRMFSPALRPLDSTETLEAGRPMPTSFLDVFALTDKVLTVYRQAPTGSAYLDYSKPVYTPGIPLESNVGAMAGQAGESAGDELLYVGDDGHLRTLTKDPQTGAWSESLVQLPAAELQEMDTYRVQVSVTDAAGYPLAASPVTVAASSPATAMVENPDGTSATLTLDQSPATLTTDPDGRLLIAIAAEGVSAPTLTVTAGDGSSITVYPSAAVNAYFKGGAPLNYLDPVDADGTLAGAQTADNQAVFPAAKDKGTAADAVKTMGQAAQQATAQGVGSAKRSTTLARRDGRLARATGKKPATAVRGVASDIDHWGHDALHAIKKGAARVDKVVYSAEAGAFQLTGDFESWGQNVVSVVVKGFEDAAHVLHAVFNHLKAWIKDAIHWLKAEVIGTLVDTFKLAGQYEQWLTEMVGDLQAKVGTGKARADAWLDAEKQKVNDEFDAWRRAVDPKSTMGSLASNASQSPVQGTRRPRIASAKKGFPTHHGLWLYNFCRWKIDAGYSDEVKTAIPKSQMDAFVNALDHAITQSVKDIGDVMVDFVKFLTNTVKHPKDVVALTEKALLDAVQGLVDWMFYILKATVDVFLDVAENLLRIIPDLLFEAPLVALPGLKQLLKLIKVDEPNLGGMVLATLAFPAVIAYKAAHKGAGYPFSSPSVSGRRSVGASAEDDLQYCAAAASFVWSAVDAISIWPDSAKVIPSRFIGIFDIAAPLVIGGLTVPYNDDVKPFGPPSFDDDHLYGSLSWVVGLFDAFLAAMDFYNDKVSGDSALEKEATANTLLWYEALSGAITLIFGCVQTKIDNHDKGWEYALTVFDSLPLLGAPLMINRFIEASDGSSPFVEGFIVGGSGIVSGLLYLFEQVD